MPTVHSRLSRSFACLSAVLAATVTLPPAAAATPHRTFYVSASAAPGGTGSLAKPFFSLAQAEAASRPGEEIRVLPSLRSLDGGIQLKPGQRLVGSGQSVTELPATAPAPRITNSSGARLDGDAVRLADGAVVRNLRISGAHRGAVYGAEVTGVTVRGNDVSGHNTSCTPGFLIPEFLAPTNVPGVGVPIVGGLQNGWAGIMIDSARRRDGTAVIADNVVRDAECGDGIDVRTWGEATYQVSVLGNDVRGLRQGPDFRSVLAIGFQARDDSALRARVLDNTQADLGNPNEVNFAMEGADSEGVFVNGVGPSTMDILVERNVYTNEDGVGGFSANGLEMVTMGAGSRATVVVRDSHFSGAPGDLIEEGALGTDARLVMVLERVTAQRSTGVGNTFVLPFNNGDCVLAGSLGARNDVRLTVRDSTLRDCANNGLSVGSNVVNGDGPTGFIGLDVDNSTITGNRGGNLGIRNFTALDRLSVRVQRTDLAGSRGLGSSLSDVAVEDFGSTGSSVIDLGGGESGSVGGNCVSTRPLAVEVTGYAVSARRLWWGRPGGPAPGSTSVLGGSLDSADPLAQRPLHCAG